MCGDLTDAFARDAVNRATTEFSSLDCVWNHARNVGPAAFENVDIDLTTRHFASMSPMGRNYRPHEVATAALFLVPEDAS